MLARYPDTTTFYRAEVTGSRKDVYRLKFEGEEDDKEMEVDKRFVLDIPGNDDTVDDANLSATSTID